MKAIRNLLGLAFLWLMVALAVASVPMTAYAVGWAHDPKFAKDCAWICICATVNAVIAYYGRKFSVPFD